MMRTGCFALIALIHVAVALAGPPVATDNRLVIELVAREPEIVTPTGLAVDERGRIWVIENNTHERPAGYKGYPSDRVRIFDDFDATGHARRIRTFADGFRNSMSLLLGKDRAVYLATRADIYLLRDTNGDDVADERKVIVKLDTPGEYPHNGLSALTFDPLGNLYFSLGENLGAPYKLIGADGTTLSGGGEGGSIYRCRPDGTGLVRIATGFWNTFGLAFDAFGRLFAVDNDPDSRGPCRLLHIIPGGDYGYRFRNGRKGLHPFTAWNGELPGTLPMVAGTSEAPCAVVPYEANGLPADYRGDLLVTSWGDHVIERFHLTPRGASVTSQAQTIVRGGEDFRPVAMVTAPDGSLYLSDWVDQSYPVHGKGRIWHLRSRTPGEDNHQAAPSDCRKHMQALWATARQGTNAARETTNQALADNAPEVRAEAANLYGKTLPADPAARDESRLLELATKDPSPWVRLRSMLELRTKPALKAVLPVLADPDPFLMGAALATLGQPGNSALLLPPLDTANPQLRLGLLLALRRTGDAEGRAVLPRLLNDPDPGVRRAAIQWVGEERLHEFAPLLKAAAARPPVTRELFEALLASNAFLAGEKRVPTDEPSGEDFLIKVVRDAMQPTAFRALALRMLQPDDPALPVALLRKFVAGSDPGLRREAVHTLALRADNAAQEALRRLAADSHAEPELRAEAVLGLAHSAPASSETRHVLISLLDDARLRVDALRSLRDLGEQPAVDQALLDWWHHAAEGNRRELAAQLILTMRSSQNKEVASACKSLAAIAGPRPANEAEWQAALAGPGDPSAGERVFFHPHGPRCYVCHRIDGRGAAIGPDLSRIGQSTPHAKLIESILLPSREIAPQFVPWAVTTRDGKLHTGVIVDEGPNSTVTLADSQGKLDVIHRTAIEERHALTKSIMPENLADLMTAGEFRDLIAFLAARK
jgi:putative membrane-bound dehydrogenase-like protein